MVVDGGPPAACGDHRADAGRHYSVAGGQPAGGDADWPRSISLLQPPRLVSAAVLHRADLRVVPVAATDQALPADRIPNHHSPDPADPPRLPAVQTLPAP